MYKDIEIKVKDKVYTHGYGCKQVDGVILKIAGHTELPSRNDRQKVNSYYYLVEFEDTNYWGKSIGKKSQWFDESCVYKII